MLREANAKRVIAAPARSSNGEKYFYYICRGLQNHTCDLPSLPAPKVEDAVLEHYTQVTIPARHHTTLETFALSATEGVAEAATILRAGLRKEIAELDREEDRFLDLIGDPEWSQDKLKARLRDVREAKQRAVRHLENRPTTSSRVAPSVLNSTLELLSHPRDLYAVANDEARKLLNRAIFTKIYVDSDEERQPAIISDDLAEPAAGLVYAVRVTDGHHDQRNMPQNHGGGAGSVG